MQKLLHNFSLLLFLFCGITAASCSNDDDEELPPLANEVEYDNTRYDLSFGAFINLGPAGISETNPTHYGRAFLLADEDLTGTTEPSIGLVTYLFSPGTANFQTGTFEYLNPTGTTSITNKYFFTGAEFLFDVNKNGTLDDDEDAIEVTGGTMTVSGTSPNYTIDCDVTLANGKTMKLQYTGTFLDATSETSNARKGPLTILNLHNLSYKLQK